MLTDVLAAITQSRLTPRRTWIVTSDPDLKPVAATYRANFLWDSMYSLNQSLSLAIDVLKKKDSEALLILPSDIPLLQPDDLDQLGHLVNQSPRPTIYLTPSYAGGTNLLFQSPIDLISPCFGVDSFKKHWHAATKTGYEPILYSATTIRLDIDTTLDLRRFLSHKLAAHTHTYQFLRSVRPDLMETFYPKTSSQ